jgi:hypothetical protein
LQIKKQLDKEKKIGVMAIIIWILCSSLFIGLRLNTSNSTGGGYVFQATVNTTSNATSITRTASGALSIQGIYYVLEITSFNPSITVTSVTDTLGNIYTRAIQSHKYEDAEIWYANFTKTNFNGNTIRVNFSASTSSIVSLYSLSGVVAGGLQVLSNNGTATSASVASFTPTTNYACLNFISSDSGSSTTTVYGAPHFWYGQLSNHLGATNFDTQSQFVNNWAGYGATTITTTMSPTSSPQWDDIVSCFPTPANTATTTVSFTSTTYGGAFSGQWIRIADSPIINVTASTGQGDSAYGYFKDSIYLVDGISGTNLDRTNATSMYNTTTNIWSTKAQNPVKAAGLTCSVITVTKSMYCFGGVGQAATSTGSTVERYNFSTNVWTSLTKQPAFNSTQGIMSVTDTSTNFIWVFGSSVTVNTPMENQTYIYFPNNDSIVRKADIPIPIGWATCGYLNHAIYVVNGYNPKLSQDLNTVMKYNITTNVWTTIPIIAPETKSGTDRNPLLINGTFLPVIEGLTNPTTFHNTNYVYDIVNNKFDYLPNSLNKRDGETATVLGNSIYAFGGRNVTSAPIQGLRFSEKYIINVTLLSTSSTTTTTTTNTTTTTTLTNSTVVSTITGTVIPEPKGSTDLLLIGLAITIFMIMMIVGVIKRNPFPTFLGATVLLIMNVGLYTNNQIVYSQNIISTPLWVNQMITLLVIFAFVLVVYQVIKRRF